jgi:hypothetical protein
MVSKEYIFQLRLNDYNLKKGLENYTVSKIFEPQVSQEVQIQKVTFHYMFFFFRKKKKYIYIYTIFFLHNLMPLLMKFNDYRKLQPILKKIIKPLIINKQKTNKSSLNILPCLRIR